MNPIKLIAFVVLFVPYAAVAHNPIVPKSIADYPVDQVARNIYVIHGPLDMPNPSNRGFANNPGFIVTAHGVIVIDPGSSVQIGKEVLKKIRAISTHPVIAVLNTHVHGDHWLGNYAIRLAYPKVPIYAHAKMIERVAAGEGETWIKVFMKMTGGAVKGTRVVGPNIGLRDNETLNLDGTILRIHHTGKAHTDHDIMIEVVERQSIFLGDIVTAHHVPSSEVPQDAYFKGQINAIQSILTLPLSTYIPGHGRSGGREVPLESLHFLEQLYAAVSKYHKQGLSDFEMKGPVMQDLAEYRDWQNFDDLGKVISFVNLEIEADSF
jgi:glyoxylase-like metal-dependent hydrolase (beta-lactamase superfamily II)